MKNRVLTAIFGMVACAFAGEIAAQTQNIRSTYFLKGATYRHELNPAFMGERGYVSLPGLGNLTVGGQSTAGVGDILYPRANGDLTTFMNAEVSSKEFLDNMPRRFKFGANLDETLLSVGFYAWGGFNTFGLSVKSNTNVYMPKELFRFMKNGVDSPEGSHYQVDNINITSTNYAEIAFGHARQLDEQWTVGAKMKFLVGLGKLTARIDRLDITAGQDKWLVTPSGAEMYASAKGLLTPTKGETKNYEDSDYQTNEDGSRTLKPGTEQQFSYDDIDYDDDNIGPTGFGLAFDFGASYKLNDEWSFSAAVLDLGFISWKNTVKGTMKNTFEFDGFDEIAIDSPLGDDDPKSLDTQIDELGDDLSDLAKFSKEGEGLKRTTALAATINLGAEYTLPMYDRLRFGLLSSTRIQGRHSWTEARLSANVAPISWFEAAVDYAVSNFGSTAGLLLNFHPRGFNFFLGADMPIGKYSKKYYAPINRAMANVSLGINFTFGPKHKTRYNCVQVDKL